MKIKPSLYIAEMHGKIGDSVVRQIGKNFYKKRINIPNKPLTQAQIEWRRKYAIVMKYWLEIGKENRKKWNEAAKGKFGTFKKGGRGALCGWTYFQSENALRIKRNLPLIDKPPEYQFNRLAEQIEELQK